MQDAITMNTDSADSAKAAVQQALHPYDDKDVWRTESAYAPPASIDIAKEQKWIDSMMGVTRNNESIYKLVWNGDREYWHQYYDKWNGLGQPTAPIVRRPRIRYKALRDPLTRAVIRDVFPPRWLILTRLEREQFADNWKQDSYVFAPEINTYKQIRPDEPPEVMWLWYATIARHTDYCCMVAENNSERCFGEYAPPSYIRHTLGMQSVADKADKSRSAFARIDSAFVSELEQHITGYEQELADTQVESQVFIENPMALLGIAASLKADVNLQSARQIVKNFYDREIDKQADALATLK